MFEGLKGRMEGTELLDAVEQLGGIKACCCLTLAIACFLMCGAVFVYVGISCRPYLNAILIGEAVMLLMLGTWALNKFLYLFVNSGKNESDRR